MTHTYRLEQTFPNLTNRLFKYTKWNFFPVHNKRPRKVITRINKLVSSFYQAVLNILQVFWMNLEVLKLGMWKRSIFMPLPPLPLPFCSSNTSSYPTHQNGSGKSCNQWSMIKRATQICLCTYAKFTITKVTSMWAGATIKWSYQTLSQNQ